jgi:hypothetical protein
MWLVWVVILLYNTTFQIANEQIGSMRSIAKAGKWEIHAPTEKVGS